jgi:hypothetical protein
MSSHASITLPKVSIGYLIVVVKEDDIVEKRKGYIEYDNATQ